MGWKDGAAYCGCLGRPAGFLTDAGYVALLLAEFIWERLLPFFEHAS